MRINQARIAGKYPGHCVGYLGKRGGRLATSYQIIVKTPTKIEDFPLFLLFVNYRN
ncbi:MAG: hypothetical protein ACMUIU_18990 [bacterium]